MKSEFTRLLDMVIARGGVHSELISEIHQAVLTQFRTRYPKQPRGVAVTVDETTGEIRIYSGNKDIMPEEFVQEASSIARKTLIEKLDQAPQPTKTAGQTDALPATETTNGSSNLTGWVVNIFFWGYNLYFLLYALAAEEKWMRGLFSGKLWDNLKNFDGLRAVMGIIMLATPVVAMVLVGRRKLYTRPGTLGKIFFLFEIPVIAIASLAGSIGGNAIWFVQYGLLTLVTIPLVLYFSAAETEFSQTGRKVLLFVQQQALVMAGYLTLLFSFFSPVILGAVAKELFRNIFTTSRYQPGIIESAFGFGSGMALFGLTVLAVAFPYVMTLALIRAWQKNCNRIETAKPELNRLQIIYLGIILAVGIGFSVQFGGNKYLDLLDKIYASRDLTEQEEIARELMPQEKQLAEIIKNYKYTGFRYPLTRDSDFVSEAYRQVFGVGRETGEIIQKVFNSLAYPLVYQGNSVSKYELESRYQFVFGHYSQETTTIKSITEARNVKLLYRKHTVTTEAGGLAARISTEEQYKNTSGAQQEIIYEFTLPEGSAVTELNLGPDLEFPGVIAPRGAAQRTYEAQIQTRRDPALLEQIGPSQYRLRVFPIPGVNDTTTLKGRLQKVQFAYVTPLTPAGYGLPEYQKATNMLADGATVFLLERDGGEQEISKQETGFVPAGISACSDITGVPVNLSGLNWQLSTNAGSGCADAGEILKRLSGKNIALVLDISAENKSSRAVSEAKSLFSNSGLLSGNQVDLYKFNRISGGATRLTDKSVADDLDIVYFGTRDWNAGLPKLTAKYDVVLIAVSAKTDLARVTGLPFAPTARTYIISDKVLPAFSHQLTTALLQSGGGVKTSLSEALTEAAIRMEAESGTDRAGTAAINKYLSLKPETGKALTDPLEYAVPAGEDDGATAALVNSVLLRMRLQGSLTDQTGDVKLMDEYGSFAKTAGIVTPFSSYIALVNEIQKQQLEQFENSYNRYQEQAITTQTGRTVTTVLNPEFADEYAPLSSYSAGGMLGGLMGVNMLEMNTIGDAGGGGNMGKITNSEAWSVNGGGSPISGLPGGSSFLILNIIVLGLGFGLYLIRTILKRNKPHTK